MKGRREQVVKEARSWIGTPYHLRSGIKGIGCDCAMLLLRVYTDCGVITEEARHDETSHGWFQHTTEEKYLLRALRHAHKTIEAVCYQTLQAKAGNAVLLKAAGSRVYNHGAIVTEWPMVVHAIGEAVTEVDVTIDPTWSFKVVTVLDPWGEE